MNAGTRDIACAAEGLARRVPEALAPLARVAYDYRWSWAEGGPEVFRDVDPERWARCKQNPVRLLEEASGHSLQRAAADEGLIARANALEALVSAERARSADPGGTQATDERPVAFFCAEFGVHASLPIYSGGLGALAGDILKEAADRAFPLVGVGLMYRQGYFRQRIDAHGRQHESWVDTDPDRVPAALVTTGENDAARALTITVPIDDREVTAQIWRVDVGRVPLFLLDLDRPENDQATRFVTARLYVGDPQLRLAQYTLLGIGGVRALHALGIDPSVVHLNEGHGALAALELAGAGASDEARAQARNRVVFTTHTPVPAGNDTYPADDVLEALERWLPEAGVQPGALLALGRTKPDDEDEAFGVTQLALRTSHAANGVSRRHGEVARDMWKDLWPGTALDDVPIGHVTNGVHLPTWVGGPMRGLLDRHLGEDWLQRAGEPATWAPVAGIPDEELWAVRSAQRAELVDVVRDPQRRRASQPRRAARVRAGRGRRLLAGRADDRLRAPPGDLQAPRPARAQPGAPPAPARR